MTRALKILLLAALAAATLATALTVPASAQRRSVAVRMADGTIQSVVVETAPEATLEDLEGLVPGEPVSYQVLEEQPPPAPPPSPETEVAPLTAP